MNHQTRVHIALPVSELEQTTGFYQALFGATPVKSKPEFVKFAPPDIPINLSLNLRESAPTITVSPAHFGIEVQSHATLQAIQRQLQQHDIEFIDESSVACCYAQQSKLWVKDPYQNNWEIYVIEQEDLPDYNCDCGEHVSEKTVTNEATSTCQC